MEPPQPPQRPGAGDGPDKLSAGDAPGGNNQRQRQPQAVHEVFGDVNAIAAVAVVALFQLMAYLMRPPPPCSC
jgi:hypothetical protein